VLEENNFLILICLNPLLINVVYLFIMPCFLAYHSRSMCVQTDKSRAGLDVTGTYSRDYTSVYDLLTHVEETLQPDIQQYISVSVGDDEFIYQIALATQAYLM